MFALPVDETLVSRHLGEGSPVPLAATEVFAVIPCRLTYDISEDRPALFAWLLVAAEGGILCPTSGCLPCEVCFHVFGFISCLPREALGCGMTCWLPD